MHRANTGLGGLPARNGLGLALLIVLLASTSSGCMFGKLRKDKKILETWGNVRGSVDATNWDGLPIIIVAGRFPIDSNHIVLGDPKTLRGPQDFSLQLEAGNYIIGAFEDPNHNARHDDGERGVLSKMIEVSGSDTVEGIDLLISEVFEREQFDDYVILHEQPFSQGDVVPLSDPRFSAEPAAKGLWRPVSYALENRPGVYLLEPYDPKRTPVLFVHGMGGYPQEFETLIGRLDTRRFQPWVFAYPSAVRHRPARRAARGVSRNRRTVPVRTRPRSAGRFLRSYPIHSPRSSATGLPALSRRVARCGSGLRKHR